MRTKVLICAAAIAAASAFTTMAQNVYSLNVVGYINIPLVEGFNLIANQLDVDGTGTNNTTDKVLPTALPPNTAVYTWDAANTTWKISQYLKNKGGTATNWDKIFTLAPGQGAWLFIPAGGLTGTSSNLTVVGEVKQGSLVNPNLAANGFGLVASMVPLNGGLTAALNYKPLVNDSVYQWNGSTWVINQFLKNKGGTATNWAPAEPSIKVGEGFWLNSGAGATWSNFFQVQ